MKSIVHRYTLQAIFVLGLLGVLVASFLTVTHYTSTPGIACPKHINNVPACDIVNQSVYSEFVGIPIALIAVVVYAIYSILTYALLKNKRIGGLSPRSLSVGLVILSSFSFLFALYLITVLYSVLQTVCLYCIIAHTITFFILGLSLFNLYLQKAKTK